MAVRFNPLLAVVPLGAFVHACTPGDVSEDTHEHHALEIPFDAQLGGVAFACDANATLGTDGTTARPRDLRFFVHDIEVDTADGTFKMELDENEFQHNFSDGTSLALLDFEDGTGTCDTDSPKTHTTLTGSIGSEGHPTAIRFKLGVPENLNHLDVASNDAPLNLPAMYWTWTGGYKFAKIDIETDTKPTFFFHLGAAGCTGDVQAGFACTHGNLADISVDSHGVIVNLDALYAGVAIDAPAVEGDAMPGCMSDPDDAECAPMLATVGLSADGVSQAGQTVFIPGHDHDAEHDE